MLKPRNINRRLFLSKSMKCGLFISAGYPYLESIGAIASNTRKKIMPTKNINQTEGDFPFFQFVNTYSIGEYIPKDQGGKFIQMEILNTEKDEIITQKIREGILKDVYNNPIDWVKFETSELEKSVWINRFYVLPSFARLYYMKKDPSYLREMMDFIHQWITDNPVNDTSNTKYNWYDMQVAWRAINLSWCYYLGHEGLSDEDKTTIYNLQHEHTKILLTDFGDQPLNEFNHQSHGALAMLYLAILFPGLPDSEALSDTAIKILNHHIDHAFFDDGGNVEHMFGYYPFIAHVFRDAEILCRTSGIYRLKNNQNLLQKMATYLIQVAQPDNTVPAINDSYEESVVSTLETIQIVLKESAWKPDNPSSHLFENSQFAIIRNTHEASKSWYINMNPAPLIGAHAHAGRMAINFWFNNAPFFVDSGCCSYDDLRLVNWYRTTGAHNSVIIDNTEDKATSGTKLWTPKRKTENRITHWNINDDFQFCRMKSPKTDPTNNHVLWTRDIVLIGNDFFILHDTFECETSHEFETLFHLHHSVRVQLNAEYLILSNLTDNLLFMPLSKQNKNEFTTKKNLMSESGKNILTSTISNKFGGNGIVHSSYLIAPFSKLKEINNMEIIEKYEQEDYRILIKNINNQKSLLKFFRSDNNSIAPFSLSHTITN